MVTSLWLPLAVCQAFEQAFNLTCNATEEMCLLDDDAHESLLAQNPTVTFILGPSSEPGSASVDVAPPYAAFDLSMRPPFAQRVLRAILCMLQWEVACCCLDRVFHQEVYVIADYDRSEFSVAQALFPNPASAVEILNVTTTKSDSPAIDSQEENGQDLSNGAIVGIAVGACMVLILLAVGVILYRRQQRWSNAAQAAAYVTDEKNGAGGSMEKSEFHVKTKPELGGNPAMIYQADTARDRPELSTGQGLFHARELSGMQKPAEMQAGRGSSAVDYQLAGDRQRVSELEA